MRLKLWNCFIQKNFCFVLSANLDLPSEFITLLVLLNLLGIYFLAILLQCSIVHFNSKKQKQKEEEWLNLTLLSHCWLLSIISLLHAQFSDYRYHNQCSAKIFHSEWLPVERMFLQSVSTMLLHHYKAASNCSVSQLKLVD